MEASAKITGQPKEMSSSAKSSIKGIARRKNHSQFKIIPKNPIKISIIICVFVSFSTCIIHCGSGLINLLAKNTVLIPILSKH